MGGADRCGQVGKPRHREGGGHFPKVSPLARAKAKDRETVGWRGAALGEAGPGPCPSSTHLTPLDVGPTRGDAADADAQPHPRGALSAA